MKQTKNLNLSLYEAQDKFSITSEDSSLNSNFEAIDEKVVTKQDIDSALSTTSSNPIANKAVASAISSQNTKITNLQTQVNNIDIPTKVSELTNDKGYISSYTETDPTVPSWAKAATKPAYTASEVGADAKGTAISAVSEHNIATTAHNDIRLLVTELTTRLNALANSDDTTLDQLNEIVAYIKANRELIESVTTDKVNVSDIINNLTTNVTNKPLSAAQGVALKSLIDAIKVPTKVSELTNDKGYLTSYTETDPTVPSWAKAATKPTYTAAEVGALPSTTLIPSKTSQLTNDSGYLTSIPSEYVTETELNAKKYLTSYTETDPTVPSWAKASTKPSYSKSEVGLGNVDNVKQYSASNPPPYPVTKVNNKTGNVTLTASDVGADASGTASSAISAHNSNAAAHTDIRNSIKDLQEQIDHLTGEETPYTNVLSSALAADGVSIYNGKGWKENTRINSSGQDVEGSGKYLTGYILCKKGDVVRLKNIAFINTEEWGTYAVNLCSTVGATTYESYNGTYLTQYANAVWDVTGNLSQFSVHTNAYIRIQCTGISDNSVITINEEIPEETDKVRIENLENMVTDIDTRVAALENSNNEGENIPSYWQTALDEGVEAINTALCNAGSNKSAFLFYTDVHWNYGSQMSPTLLKYLYRHTGMTKTFFGGDIVNDEATDYDTMEYLWEWRKQLKDLPNHHSVVGNHDDGNATNNLFSEQYVYGYLLSAEETEGIVRGKGMYYYIDNGAEMTRYIFLDTAYQGVDENQQAFVKQALLSAQSGWHIVAVAHIWFDTDWTDSSHPVVGELNSGASIILSMFDNYNSRSGEYAECEGWVEFCVGGHTHWDFDGTSTTGIPIVLVETDSKHTRSGFTYTKGTTTESAVNGIVADYGNHKIYVVRIGRGESREVTITNYVVSYTNRIPISTTNDGVTIYNADETAGYKANTRWSSSSNAEKTDSSATGLYITGYIPVSAGNVIRLKNITYTDASNNYVVALKSLTDTEEQCVNATNLSKYWNGVWDESENLVQFTVNSGGYKYIRIQCSGIDSTSIITINEPIE